MSELDGVVRASPAAGGLTDIIGTAMSFVPMGSQEGYVSGVYEVEGFRWAQLSAGSGFVRSAARSL
jgi:hypothetical protein